MPKVGGGRIAAIEILTSTSRTRDYIEKGEKDGRSIVDAMMDGELEGMQTFDGELERMIREGSITKETGLSYSTNANNLALSINDLDAARKEVPVIQVPESRPAQDVPNIDGFER